MQEAAPVAAAAAAEAEAGIEGFRSAEDQREEHSQSGAAHAAGKARGHGGEDRRDLLAGAGGGTEAHQGEGPGHSNACSDAAVDHQDHHGHHRRERGQGAGKAAAAAVEAPVYQGVDRPQDQSGGHDQQKIGDRYGLAALIERGKNRIKHR